MLPQTVRPGGPPCLLLGSASPVDGSSMTFPGVVLVRSLAFLHAGSISDDPQDLRGLLSGCHLQWVCGERGHHRALHHSVSFDISWHKVVFLHFSSSCGFC